MICLAVIVILAILFITALLVVLHRAFDDWW